MPKLSVIVPIYNVEKFLPECIESAVNQPFESENDFEVILVNDGSPDNCLSICREYEKKHGNVRVVNQANAGVSAARNAGLDLATGEYVCFLDGDDCFLPGALPPLVSAAEAHDVDMLSFSACSGTDFEKSRASAKTGGGIDVLSGRDYKISHWMHGTVWCKLFRRDFLTRHGLRFNPRMTVLEDNRFWIDAVPFLEKVAVAKAVGYFYRINFSGFTKNNSSENRILWWRLWRDEVFSRIDAQMREYLKQGDSELAAAYEKWRRGIILPMFWRALKGGVPVAEMKKDIEMLGARGCYPVVSPLHSSFVSRVAARVFSSRFLLLTALRIRNAFK